MDLVKQDYETVRHYLASRNLGTGFVSSIHEADEMYSIFTKAIKAPVDHAIISYFDAGYQLWRTIQDALEQANRKPASVARLLEFACGYGRVTRYLVGEFPADRITVADIQPRAIEFQRHFFTTNVIASDANPDNVPLEGPYDLIIVISLFSHLPLHRFQQWLVRLYEHLGPSGLLLFSVHPQSMIPNDRRNPSGFNFETHRLESNRIAGGDFESDLNEYGTTYASVDAVKRIAAKCGVHYFYSCPKGLLCFQDLYLATNTAIPAMESWKRPRWIKGLIEFGRNIDAKHVEIGGWCVDVSRFEPPRELRVWIDGNPLIGELSLCCWRPDIAMKTGRPEFLHSGWVMRGPMPSHDVDHFVMVDVDGFRLDNRRLEFTDS